jgi:hypothetical protein
MSRPVGSLAVLYFLMASFGSTESGSAQTLLATCRANAADIRVFSGGSHCRRYADTAWLGNITCHNQCDTCCQFYVDIANLSKCTPIVEVQICVLEGWATGSQLQCSRLAHKPCWMVGVG